MTGTNSGSNTANTAEQTPKLRKISIAGIVPALIWISACFIIGGLLGFKAGASESIDFQWPGAHLLSLGINPYAEALRSPANPIFTESRWPNYAQALYILMLPLGWLDLENAKIAWAGLNLLFCFAIIYSLARTHGLFPGYLLVVLGFWMVSSPVRNTFSTGQTSLLVASVIACILKPGKLKHLFYGLSYLKYSFAPFLAPYYLVYHGKKALSLSLLPVTLGALFFLIYFKDPDVLIQPLKVASSRVGVGVGGTHILISSLPEALQGDIPAFFVRILSISAGAIMAVLLSKKIHKRCSTRNLFGMRTALASSIIISLIFSNHLYYDYSITVIPAAIFLSLPSSLVTQLLFWPAITYAWFGYGRIYSLVSPYWASLGLLVANILMLVSLIVLSLENKNHQSPLINTDDSNN